MNKFLTYEEWKIESLYEDSIWYEDPELLESMDSDIKDTIKKHKMVRIYYEGDGTIEAGWRWIEVYAYGVSKAGNDIIRAFQISGSTDSKKYGWKIFLVDKIKKWTNTPRIFQGARKGFNPTGDRGMSKIHLIGKFKGTNTYDPKGVLESMKLTEIKPKGTSSE